MMPVCKGSQRQRTGQQTTSSGRKSSCGIAPSWWGTAAREMRRRRSAGAGLWQHSMVSGVNGSSQPQWGKRSRQRRRAMCTEQQQALGWLQKHAASMLAPPVATTPSIDLNHSRSEISDGEWTKKTVRSPLHACWRIWWHAAGAGTMARLGSLSQWTNPSKFAAGSPFVPHLHRSAPPLPPASAEQGWQRGRQGR